VVDAQHLRAGKALRQQFGGIARPAAQVHHVAGLGQRHARQQLGCGAGALIGEAQIQRRVPVVHGQLLRRLTAGA